MKAVIQAGGMGTRLRPYTLILPKPMMPLGDKPVIEVLLKWLRKNGIKDAYITTGYLGHLIRSLCGDGAQWGLNIEYSNEPEPLGTVGALNLIREQLDSTFLVLNGDLITNLDINEFLEFHEKKKAKLTIAGTMRTVNVDLGVIEEQDNMVKKFKEKPTLRYNVSMGVYCMEPEILDYIPKGIPFGFDDLVHAMLRADDPIALFNHDGMWMDIGRPEDFQAAQKEFEDYRGSMLGDL